MKKIILLAIVLLTITASIKAQKTFQMQLWSNEEATGDASTAQLYGFLPKSGNGQAVIVCPGGGYGGLCSDYEGTDFAKSFNDKGIAVFVLMYRLPAGRSNIPLADAEQAMRVVRKNATAWGVNTNCVGIMGSSAGGHLAATLATHYSSAETRPDFQILLYPVITMDKTYTHMGTHDNLLGANTSATLEDLYSNEKHVTAQTPQCFIAVCAADELVPVKNSLAYTQALIDKSVPVSLHVYPGGFHGFGEKSTFKDYDAWHEEVFRWMEKEVKATMPSDKLVYSLVDSATNVINSCTTWSWDTSALLITKAEDNGDNQFSANYKSATLGTYSGLIDRRYNTFFESDEIGNGQKENPYLQVDLRRNDLTDVIFTTIRFTDGNGTTNNFLPNDISVYATNNIEQESSWKRIVGFHNGFPKISLTRYYVSPLIHMDTPYRYMRFVVNSNLQGLMNAGGFTYFNMGEFQMYIPTIQADKSPYNTAKNVKDACDSLKAVIATANEDISNNGITNNDVDALQKGIAAVLAAKETPDGIITPSPAKNEVVNVFSTDGIMQKENANAENATTGLKKGIYVVGNKKVLVK